MAAEVAAGVAAGMAAGLGCRVWKGGPWAPGRGMHKGKGLQQEGPGPEAASQR